MKKISIIFLQLFVVLIGIGTLVLMLWEPHIEGRNINATLYQIYFHDPFLAYVYTASIAFFITLYQIFKLLGYIKKNELFTQVIIKALRTIKYCMMTLIAFIVGAEIYFFTVQRNKEEDIAGGVAMGLVMIFISIVVTTTAALFERRLQKN